MKQVLQYYFMIKSPSYEGPRMGYKAIADLYGLPRETFRCCTTGEFKGYYGHLSGGKNMPKVLTPNEEIELASHIGKFAQAGFPFTPSEICTLAYEYAGTNGICGFSSMNKQAGHKWLYGFMKHHKELTIKTRKLLSVFRAKSANLDVITNWFKLYQEVLEENNIDSPLYVWNVDECGCIDSPKPKKVVCIKKIPANQLGPAEKGETTTAIVFVNAAGMHTHPIVIHKGGRVMDTWKNDMPKGYKLGASENGWINKKLFYQYGKILIKYLQDWGLLEGNKKHLLLMDSHNAHTFNYQFMKMMINNNIVLLALPSHTTHLIQPLDDVPFASFKTEWYECV